MAKRQNSTSQRAKPGAWETAFFDALSRGHTIETAAGKAGIHRSTVYKRRDSDPQFAADLQIAYDNGTAWLVDVAHQRVTDPDKPGDTILKHLLSVRGLSERVINQLEGNDERPVFVIDAESYAGGRKRNKD